jgi:hypothetical protein
MPIVAWYVLSKVSYMKRVIREVLPTVWRKHTTLARRNKTSRSGYFVPLCSPRKTSLFGLLVPERCGCLFVGSLLEFLQRIRVCRLSHCAESWEMILD